jgi:hypothetical protein
MEPKSWKRVSLGFIAAVVMAMAPVASATYDLFEYDLAVQAALDVDPDVAPFATNNPALDFAVGGGQHVCFPGPACVDEGFAAHSGPNGEDPRGHVSATFPAPADLGPTASPDQVKGPVTCVNVVGNEAFIIFIQTKEDSSIAVGTPVLLHVVDNGNPINGTPPDLIRNSFPGGYIGPFPEPPCGIPFFPPVPLDRGNIVVHDAQ